MGSSNDFNLSSAKGLRDKHTLNSGSVDIPPQVRRSAQSLPCHMSIFYDTLLNMLLCSPLCSPKDISRKRADSHSNIQRTDNDGNRNDRGEDDRRTVSDVDSTMCDQALDSGSFKWLATAPRLTLRRMVRDGSMI